MNKALKHAPNNVLQHGVKPSAPMRYRTDYARMADRDPHPEIPFSTVADFRMTTLEKVISVAGAVAIALALILAGVFA